MIGPKPSSDPARAEAGRGMCVAIKSCEISSRDGREHIRVAAGRDRVVVDHWAVRERPEAFKPADPSDQKTRTQLRSHLERALKDTSRQLTRAGARRGSRAPARSTRKPWKL